MALEEIIELPCLPKSGYYNPVRFELKDDILRVSYQKEGIYLIKHYINKDGPLGYNLYRLYPFERGMVNEFINGWINRKHKWIREEYGYFFDISRLPDDDRNGLMKILQKSEDFATLYKELIGKGYWREEKRVYVIKDQKTLSPDDLQEIGICNVIILKNALDKVKNEEINLYINSALSFNQCMLLPCIKNQNN